MAVQEQKLTLINQMKKTLIAAMVSASTAIGQGQGTIYVDNLANTGIYNGAGGTVANPFYSDAVTQNGLIFTTDPAAQAGNIPGGPAGSMLIGVDFSWVLYGGATAYAAQMDIQSGIPLASETGSQITGDNPFWGQVQNQSYTLITVPGSTAGKTVYLDLQIWEGATFPTMLAAQQGNGYFGETGIFANPSGGAGIIPGPGADLTGMPDMLLDGGPGQWGPEPGTFALLAFGGASLLMFRRRK